MRALRPVLWGRAAAPLTAWAASSVSTVLQAAARYRTAAHLVASSRVCAQRKVRLHRLVEAPSLAALRVQLLDAVLVGTSDSKQRVSTCSCCTASCRGTGCCLRALGASRGAGREASARRGQPCWTSGATGCSAGTAEACMLPVRVWLASGGQQAAQLYLQRGGGQAL